MRILYRFILAGLIALTSLAMNAQVAPLIKTTWSQRSPYNDMCPKGMLAGCVAIAMAQVMNYWQWPQVGIGKSSYKWTCTDYGSTQSKTLSAKYGETYYRWDDMEGESVSVAQLVYHCGVSIMMDYSSYFSGSNEYYAKSALVDYFGYSDEIALRARNSYSDEDWAALLKDNLDKGWPIIYSSGGHTFVLDGYNEEGLFHTNQGFGSSDTGYTKTLDKLGSKTSSSALINIHPDYSSKGNVSIPTMVIYKKTGSSSHWPITDVDAVEWNQTAVTMTPKTGDKVTLNHSAVSYMKPLIPINENEDKQ